MKKVLLGTTFSPAMLTEFKLCTAKVREITLADALIALEDTECQYESCVGHEVTAHILTALLGIPVEFRRVIVELEPGDVLICVIPKFRADVAREFSYAEVAHAGFRCFSVSVEKQEL